jgi:hypothetical protein
VLSSLYIASRETHETDAQQINIPNPKVVSYVQRMVEWKGEREREREREM